MIAIIDYGMGNIHSVQKALESMGAKTIVTNKPADIKVCDKVVLPGVGAFADAVAELKKQDLLTALKEHIKAKKIFLGICLGMQLLFERSDEAKGIKGLGILKGEVKKFKIKGNLKVPHMGWNQLKIVSRCQGVKVSKECPLLKDIPDNAYVYFCHSYYPQPKDKDIIAATTEYGISFSPVLWRENIYGVQFHPEKSQETGLKILKNFVELC
ncbi:MAG: imidazole glycerol phosphate synthase subunit HisH [Candidatus Omnitrophica bacterium]|nr:imidazole glycerol phosphate synthase subunit HisH [Candidatus Omnitrophota bacterium]MDD5591821.1 imidazole glycerol phosphate synthase subunit HisH [Candidatus Omnitrophota bacterium]